jgi:hypothetical protein
LRWSTGFPLEVFEKARPDLHERSPADVRIRALRDRGYLANLRPTNDDLLAAASANEDDVAYNACRLLLSRLGRDPAACHAAAAARLDLLRRALRR